MMRTRVVPASGYFISILLGCVLFWLVCGDPFSVIEGGFMIDTDYPNAAAAYEVFVRSGWTWPLGENPDFGGVNIFFSDAAPWLALSAKFIYGATSWLLEFHWLLLINTMLFALMARRLAHLVVKDEVDRWFITLLLIFSLIMPVRMIGAQHIALSSYWVVLWAMCCVPLANENKERFFKRWEFLFVLSFSILTHAYLGAMSIVLVGGLLISERRWFSLPFVLLVPLLCLYVLGVFHGEHSTTEGAKAYSLDILAFFESLGWGVIPNLYEIKNPTQGDAILYLGTGVVGLIVVLALFLLWKLLVVREHFPFNLEKAVSFLKTAEGKRFWVLFASSFFLALYAMAFSIRVADHVVLSWDIPPGIELLYERFRVAGRFAAPMAYMLIISVALAWSAIRKESFKTVVFLVTLLSVVLQISDVRYAGSKSPPESWLKDAQVQRNSVEKILEPGGWSGRVFKDVGYFELEQQRLLDKLLVDYGAREFSVVHGARLDPDEVKRRSGFENAERGDVAIFVSGARGPECQRSTQVKSFTLCVLQ